ncbi:MAG TPA: glycosyltransferase [Solirubrobacteraceae bacterium]|jgi:uncharacterized protein (TIGR03382 family)|nr:glycosyltransferase [Solirubrobacteraceae bacterium]
MSGRVAAPAVAGWLAIPLALLAAGAAAGTGHGLPALALAGGAVGAVAVALAPERALLALLVALPFCVYPLSTGGLSVFLALPVAVAIAAGMALVAPPARTPLRLPVVAFAVLAGLATASALRSADTATAGSRVVYLLAFGLLAWATATAVRSGLLTPRRIVAALVAGAALAALALIAQFAYALVAGRDEATEWLASVYPAFGGQRASGTQSSNWWIPRLALMRGVFPFMAAPSAGIYMAFGVLGAVWLRRERRRAALPAGATTAALALCTVALAFTFSRQAWLAVLVGLVVLGRGRARAAVLVPLGALLALLAFVNVPGRGTTFGSYLLSSADAGTESTGVRIGLWEEAIGLVADRPLLGVGPGQYGSLNPFPETAPIYYAHNVVLDMAVEAGVLAALALVAVFAVAIAGAWRRGADLAAALLVAYVVAGMVDDVLYFPRNGFALAVAFGLAAVGVERAGGRRVAGAVGFGGPREGAGHGVGMVAGGGPADGAGTAAGGGLPDGASHAAGDGPPEGAFGAAGLGAAGDAGRAAEERDATRSGAASPGSAAAAGGAAAPAARIAAIVATRNRAALLSDCLETLAAQDVAPGTLEVVVVDDGSDVDLAPVVQRHASERVPMRLVRQEPAGLSAARDRGVAATAAGILAFLDDDVLVSPGWAAAVAAAFDAFGCDGLAGRIDLRTEGPIPRWLTRPRRAYVGELDLGPRPRWLVPGETPFGGNCAVTRSFHERVGGFRSSLGREGEKLLSNEEVDFFQRVRDHGGRLLWAPDAHLLHRVPADRLTEGWFLRRAYAQGVSDESLLDRARGARRTARAAREVVRMGRAAPILAKRLAEGRGAADARIWLAYCRGRLAAVRER